MKLDDGRLDNGQRLPDLTLETVEDGTMQLPADAGEGWAVILFYRGHW